MKQATLLGAIAICDRCKTEIRGKVFVLHSIMGGQEDLCNRCSKKYEGRPGEEALALC